MALNHLDVAPRFLRGRGTEIGAFTTPIPGIRPVYVDRFAEYAGQKTLAEYFGDACDLPFHDNSLDFVASSHVLEHVANPVAALREWYRVLKHRGIVYCCLPHRARTFDHGRALTDPEHCWSDFTRGTTPVDATHIDDFCFHVDWAMFSPASTPEYYESERRAAASRYHAAVQRGDEINIHFHTFEPPSFARLLEISNSRNAWPGRIEVVECHNDFPQENPIGFLVVARVRKTLRERCRSAFKRSPGSFVTKAREFKR